MWKRFKVFILSKKTPNEERCQIQGAFVRTSTHPHRPILVGLSELNLPFRHLRTLSRRQFLDEKSKVALNESSHCLWNMLGGNRFRISSIPSIGYKSLDTFSPFSGRTGIGRYKPKLTRHVL